MKKIYFLTTVLFLGTSINAQITDFESFGLSPDSFDNGSGGGGDFVIGNTILSNFYDTTWSSWSGFAISNKTDSITAGWGNQYSSVNGSGADNSNNYAVYFEPGTITLNNSDVFSSFKITNTAYAAISMRDGDAFAKKFGSTVDANGVIDGTNGEDFFKVWIIVENAGATQKDSMEFFLADYRFADSTQDYILKTWEVIDLTSFAFDVVSIDFKMESSDNGPSWMNTPGYFAIDDIVYGQAGVNEKEEFTINAYPNPVKKIITVQGGKGALSLVDVNGNTIYSINHNEVTKIDMSIFSNGIYFLKLINDTGVGIQKIIK